MLLFEHIPKTAGSTLLGIIEAQYAPDRIYQVNSPVVESLKAFRGLSSEERRQYDVVAGHGAFGLRGELPEDGICITMLRDPVARVLSNYAFIKGSPQHPLHTKMVHLSLEQYVEGRVNLQIDNGQVRSLSIMGSGLGPAVAYGDCTRDMLETAVANIKNVFSVTGLTERFDESLVLIARTLGWRGVCYQRRKVSGTPLRQSDVPASTLEMVRQHVALDLELYRFAQQHLEHRLASETLGYRLELKRLAKRQKRS